MRQITLWSAIIGSVVVLMTGCTSNSPSSSSQEEHNTYSPHIDPSEFTTKVDNAYFPMEPGTTFLYKGGTEHSEMTVTHQTKKVMGVECVVVDHREWEGEMLIEKTYDWFAQDKEGSVWYFGEDTKEYKNGKVVSTKGSWEAGVDAAKPGIIMQAHPKVGQSYRQEYYKGEAEDMAKVQSLNDSVTVAYGSFDPVLVTKEWTPLEPSYHEHKCYARGVGQVYGWGLELVDMKT